MTARDRQTLSISGSSRHATRPKSKGRRVRGPLQRPSTEFTPSDADGLRILWRDGDFPQSPSTEFILSVVEGLRTDSAEGLRMHLSTFLGPVPPKHPERSEARRAERSRRAV